VRCGQLRKLHESHFLPKGIYKLLRESSSENNNPVLISARVSTKDNWKVAALFTIVSLIRSYCLRRLFNWWHVYKALRAPDTQMVAVGGERRDLGG